MNPSISVVRAIAAELGYRVFKPLVIVAAVVSIILIAVMVWLITISAWWLLLALPVFIAIIVATLLFVFAGITLRLVSPRPSIDQKKKVSAFVDKVQHLSEVTQTPKAILLFRAVQDVMVPNGNGFIKTIVADTTSLGSDFKELQMSFSRRSL